MSKVYPADAMFNDGKTVIVVVDDKRFRFRECLTVTQAVAVCDSFYQMAAPQVVGVRIGDAIVGLLEDAWA
jgi:hypothetical protein